MAQPQPQLLFSLDESQKFAKKFMDLGSNIRETDLVGEFPSGSDKPKLLMSSYSYYVNTFSRTFTLHTVGVETVMALQVEACKPADQGYTYDKHIGCCAIAAAAESHTEGCPASDCPCKPLPGFCQNAASLAKYLLAQDPTQMSKASSSSSPRVSVAATVASSSSTATSVSTHKQSRHHSGSAPTSSSGDASDEEQPPVAFTPSISPSAVAASTPGKPAKAHSPVATSHQTKGKSPDIERAPSPRDAHKATPSVAVPPASPGKANLPATATQGSPNTLSLSAMCDQQSAASASQKSPHKSKASASPAKGAPMMEPPPKLTLPPKFQDDTTVVLTASDPIDIDSPERECHTDRTGVVSPSKHKHTVSGLSALKSLNPEALANVTATTTVAAAAAQQQPLRAKKVSGLEALKMTSQEGLMGKDEDELRKEIARLRLFSQKIMRDSDDCISELKKELHEAVQRENLLKDQLASMQTSSKKLQKECDAWVEEKAREIARLRGELAREKESSQKAQRALGESERSTSATIEEIEELRRQVELANSVREKIERDRDYLVETLKLQKQETLKKLEESQATQRATSELLEDARISNAASKLELKERDEQIKKLKEQLKDSLEQAATLRKGVEGLRTQLTSEGEEKGKTRKEMEQMLREYDLRELAYKSEKERLVKQIAEQGREIAKVMGERDAALAEIGALKRKVSDRDAEYLELTQADASRGEEKQRLIKEKEAVEAELQRMTEKYEERGKELRQMAAEREFSKRALSELQKDKEYKERELVANRESSSVNLKQQAEILRQTNEDVNTLRKDVSFTKTKLGATEEMLAKEQQKNVELVKEMQALTEQMKVQKQLYDRHEMDLGTERDFTKRALAAAKQEKEEKESVQQRAKEAVQMLQKEREVTSQLKREVEDHKALLRQEAEKCAKFHFAAVYSRVKFGGIAEGKQLHDAEDPGELFNVASAMGIPASQYASFIEKKLFG